MMMCSIFCYGDDKIEEMVTLLIPEQQNEVYERLYAVTEAIYKWYLLL